MMTGRTPRRRPIGWDDLDADTQAAIDREAARIRLTDPEHLRRLAALLGLKKGGTDAAA